jgi:aspartate 1-decarboxylase
LPIRHADLRTNLSAKILALTGQRISTQEIYTDGHLAVAGVDGASFRLYYDGDLVLVRSCAYCGTGHFESPEIISLSDLGYAVSAWRPLHEDCEDYSSEELPDF